MLGFLDKKPEEPKKPDETELWISESKLKAVRTAFDDRMDGLEKRLDEYKKRLARCEYDYGSQIRELEGQLVQAEAETEQLKQENVQLKTPTASEQDELAKIFDSWGYSAEQIIKIAALAKDNEQLLNQFASEADTDEPLHVLIRKNRFVIETLLKSHIGEPAKLKNVGSDTF